MTPRYETTTYEVGWRAHTVCLLMRYGFGISSFIQNKANLCVASVTVKLHEGANTLFLQSSP